MLLRRSRWVLGTCFQLPIEIYSTTPETSTQGSTLVLLILLLCQYMSTPLEFICLRFITITLRLFNFIIMIVTQMFEICNSASHFLLQHHHHQHHVKQREYLYLVLTFTSTFVLWNGLAALGDKCALCGGNYSGTFYFNVFVVFKNFSDCQTLSARPQKFIYKIVLINVRYRRFYKATRRQ